MSTEWTVEKMNSRVVRYTDLRPCLNAFVDAYTPGSDQKENFTIIGPGVAEHPGQYVHINEPHGFNIGGARQPPGCTNSQHSHETEEVFIVHSGRWAFRWGVDGKDGEVVLGPGDCISLPLNVFRGFENVGDELGYLFAVLGGDDPGNVLWAPDVFDKAEEYGLVLLENGRLVDTTRGETVPDDASPMLKTSAEQVAAHQTMTTNEMSQCVFLERDQTGHHGSFLTHGIEGVEEYAMIGPANAVEGIAAGKMAWQHGFHLRRVDLCPAAALPFHAREEEEVVYVHRGELRFEWEFGDLRLNVGDVLTVPQGLMRHFSNPGTEDLVLYVVRGGNTPKAATWKRADTCAPLAL